MEKLFRPIKSRRVPNVLIDDGDEDLKQPFEYGQSLIVVAAAVTAMKSSKLVRVSSPVGYIPMMMMTGSNGRSLIVAAASIATIKSSKLVMASFPVEYIPMMMMTDDDLVSSLNQLTCSLVEFEFKLETHYNTLNIVIKRSFL